MMALYNCRWLYWHIFIYKDVSPTLSYKRQRCVRDLAFVLIRFFTSGPALGQLQNGRDYFVVMDQSWIL